jgi:hypothetical protein
MGAAPAGLIVYAAFASRHERMAHIPALLLGVCIAAGGPLFYVISRKLWTRNEVAVSAAD